MIDNPSISINFFNISLLLVDCKTVTNIACFSILSLLPFIILIILTKLSIDDNPAVVSIISPNSFISIFLLLFVALFVVGDGVVTVVCDDVVVAVVPDIDLVAALLTTNIGSTPVSAFCTFTTLCNSWSCLANSVCCCCIT